MTFSKAIAIVSYRAWVLTQIVWLQDPFISQYIKLILMGMVSRYTLATLPNNPQNQHNWMALYILAHPTFRYSPMLQKDLSSICSSAVETAGNEKSGHWLFHFLQCQQKSGLCEGPRRWAHHLFWMRYAKPLKNYWPQAHPYPWEEASWFPNPFLDDNDNEMTESLEPGWTCLKKAICTQI